jgi:hypothetical protein
MGTLVLVLMLCLGVMGFYRGWFTLSSHGCDAQSNKVDVKLTVDPDKMKADAEKVKEKTTVLGNQAKDKVKSIDK